ncbi:hypothetical protein RE476_11355 [Methanolobus mangrovi]|uniref:VCBS repeat-containing protein n=1 Tax=Methanolobus mangrovi TaxID=3072977 RepID=A0AA51UFE0_9EURY|nr:hypothetical protein [Methanolobus mangrovi]WMW21953.1 hypothetical protein RE476_11355 [Methanolobus mangrovi]
MMAGNRNMMFILLGMLAVIVLIAIAINGTQDTQKEVTIPEEILDCDYCTFNYRTPFTLAYTYLQPDGNRVVRGNMDLLSADYTDVELSGKPEWVISAASNNGSIWAVVLDDGAVEAFELSNGDIGKVNISPAKIHADSPPILMIKNDEAFLLAPGLWNESLLSHPVVLSSSGRTVFIETSGDLVFRVNDRESARLEVNALPDARLLLDEDERILLLTGPTEDYKHGVLGDIIEASGITLVETAGTPAITRIITVPEGDVIEGIAPIWTDLDGDGIREIIVTLSNAEDGSRHVVFDDKGNIMASGPTTGNGYRWRHQIAVAPFGPNEEIEIAGVLTPHIEGIVEFYQLNEDELTVMSGLSGYSSHMSGSRDLDMAVAGNFDNDTRFELLVPTQDFRELTILEHNETGIHMQGHLLLDGALNTNIAAVTLANNSVAMGVGTDAGILRIWY